MTFHRFAGQKKQNIFRFPKLSNSLGVLERFGHNYADIIDQVNRRLPKERQPLNYVSPR